MDEKIAVVVHIGSYNLWESMEKYLDKLTTINYDLWITISIIKNNLDTIEKISSLGKYIMEKYPTAHVITIPNKGFDIGGFFYTLKEMMKKEVIYDYILKLHTKTDNKYRDELTLGLIENCENIFNLFKNNPKIGMIGSKKWTRMCNLQRDILNRYHLGRIIDNFKLNDNTITCKFIGGTVFWVRYDLIKKIFAGHINRIISSLNDNSTYDEHWMKINNEKEIGNILWDDLPNKKYYRDGMIEHGYERFFGYSLYYHGYELYEI